MNLENHNDEEQILQESSDVTSSTFNPYIDYSSQSLRGSNRIVLQMNSFTSVTSSTTRIPSSSSLNASSSELLSTTLSSDNRSQVMPEALDSSTEFSVCPVQTYSVPIQEPTKPTGRQRYHLLSPRQKFLVFIKVLLKVIEQQDDQRKLRSAKAVVAECTYRNRVGDINYCPLQEAITERLRLAVGDMYWNLAKSYCVDV
jgi:hypothetical protein